jgi:hypothetical protein
MIAVPLVAELLALLVGSVAPLVSALEILVMTAHRVVGLPCQASG